MNGSTDPSIIAHPALSNFSETTRLWLANTFVELTPPQIMGWPVIKRGDHTLIVSPTGSGKTLAAFLAAIDEVMFNHSPGDDGCSILYISPLKALAADVQRNLRDPLYGVEHLARTRNERFYMPRIAIRTGDTTTAERNAFIRRGADILITTPESLFLLLQGQAAAKLQKVRWVIIDEIHTLVGSKRGAHLALSLERLQEICDTPVQRIGLSATVRPIDEATRFLGGYQHRAGDDSAHQARPRSVTVVNADASRRLMVDVQLAGTQMPAEGGEPGTMAGDTMAALASQLLEIINSHTSTLIFVNSRRMAERLAAAINELADEELVLAHHGSVAREKRLAIEQNLKAGLLSALIATSSLELGIDIGAIDLVVQVDSPPGVASALQRVGRASHQVGRTSHGIVVARFRGDLPACAALPALMKAGEIEPVHVPRNPLDILAQHISAMVSAKDWSVEELYALIRCAAPFCELPRDLLHDTLDMLSGKYPSTAFNGLRARIVWDRQQSLVSGRVGTKQLVIANAGTIPDRGQYGVYLSSQPDVKGRLGELDEEMVFECRVGDVFILGATSWCIDEITRDRVLVSPAAGRPGRMPFWHSDRQGRHVHYGRAIGELADKLISSDAISAVNALMQHHGMDEPSARTLMDYLMEQQRASAVPTHKRLVIEASRDDAGEWRVCLLSPLGSRVHAPLAMAISARVTEITGYETDVLWFDDGLVLRFPDTPEPPNTISILPDAADLERLLMRYLCGGGAGARAAGQGAPVNTMVATRFREAAGRALMLPRRRPGARSPLWLLRKRAIDLLQAAAEYPDFPLLLEVFREILQDDFDVPALADLLRSVEADEVEVTRLVRPVPSPFASSLLFSYVANFMYEGDVPAAERKAQALQVDHARLRSLMGADAVRSLLDGNVITAWQDTAQYLTTERKAAHPDALHDLLLDIGDLTDDEVRERCASPHDAQVWLLGLQAAGRILQVVIAGELRWIAVEDVARYRDGLGTSLPDAVPTQLLAAVREPLHDLVTRYARTHGPFTTEDLSRRLGLPAPATRLALQALAARGRVSEGEFLPESHQAEWCDTGVLRVIRYRTLEQLRREIEPVSIAAYVRTLHEMHGLAVGQPRLDVRTVISMLEGVDLPASQLDSEIFGRRLENYEPDMIDSLIASGELVWIAARKLGAHDGMVRLYYVDDAPTIATTPPQWPPEGTAGYRICEFLRERGASFFSRITAAVGGFPAELEEEMWALAWAGIVTNDSLQPLRSFTTGTVDRADRHLGARVPRGARYGAKPAVPARVSGRWWLVEECVADGHTSTEKVAGRLKLLLRQNGLVTRDIVAAAGIPGGFSAIYPLLTSMELAGKLRRGNFVADLGGLQFALPEVVESLRRLRESPKEPQCLILSACDPANPYGLLVPWPATSSGRRVSRTVGATVGLVDGYALFWLNADGSQLYTFVPVDAQRDISKQLRAAVHALALEVETGRRKAIHITSVDGTSPAPPLWHDALLAEGFRQYESGYQRRRR